VYYGGVTKIVGEPRDNLTKGVELEHVDMQDSKLGFTTGNYGITTYPKLEHELIANYTDKGGTDVAVTGTRRCSTEEGVPAVDERTIRPVSYFEELPIVKQVGLTWLEILVVVLYTGPLFVLYNGILRGFGCCGCVDEGVLFWKGDFAKQFNATTIEERMKEAGHKFSSTIHVLVSAVKKLQRLSAGVQGTMVYRGLGGLDVKTFIDGNGFTERAFTSTTKNLEVALEYSGAKSGRTGTVLAMELSEVDQGAELQDFSQYPGERETLWNACSYMEALKGREEWRITPCGPVKLVYVKMNAANKALTVQELESRRKNIVVNMLETLSTDIQRDMKASIESDDFQERLAVDTYLKVSPSAKEKYVRMFLDKVSQGVEQRVGHFRKQEASWYHDTRKFAQSVSSAASLPLLSASWVTTYKEDKAIHICGYQEDKKFFESIRNESRLRQRLLEQAGCGDAAAVEVQRHAAASCVLKGYVHDHDDLEKDMVDGGEESPLIEKSRDGDGLAVKLLVDAKADM